MLRTSVSACIAIITLAASGCASKTGFFDGMHIQPYKRNSIIPGNIYTTLENTGGEQKFGVRVAEFCSEDAKAIKKKFGSKLALSSSYAADEARFTTSNKGNLGISGVLLDRVDIGGSANIVASQTYEFKDVITKSVTLEGAELVRNNIGKNCRSIVEDYKKMGRFVFVALEVIVPKHVKVHNNFDASASANSKIKVAENIKSGIVGEGSRSRQSTVSSQNVDVEVVAIEI